MGRCASVADPSPSEKANFLVRAECYSSVGLPCGGWLLFVVADDDAVGRTSTSNRYCRRFADAPITAVGRGAIPTLRRKCVRGVTSTGAHSRDSPDRHPQCLKAQWALSKFGEKRGGGVSRTRPKKSTIAMSGADDAGLRPAHACGTREAQRTCDRRRQVIAPPLRSGVRLESSLIAAMVGMHTKSNADCCA
jgi:hypothetical protein